jgi:hypothetical protein
MRGDKLRASVIYLPYDRFIKSLDFLINNPLPPIIHRDMFEGTANDKGQIIGALRFFDLIDVDGKPSTSLMALHLDPDDQKAYIRDWIKDKYKNLLALDLTKTTRSDFEQHFSGTFEISGTMLKKAKSFFLHALRDVGIPFSPSLAARAPSSGVITRTKVVSAKPTFSAPVPSPERERKTIQLKCGGSLTLSVSVNLFELKGADRKFVFELIDKLDEYESGIADQDGNTSNIPDKAVRNVAVV